jgi:hypothetical protein
VKKLALFALMISLIAGFSTTQAQAQSGKWAGTWKLDSGRSRLHNPAPQQVTLHIEAMDAKTVKFTATGTGPEGKPFTESFEGKANGDQFPLIVNGAETGRVSYRRESDTNFSANGILPEGTVTESLTLSPDGKTITVQVQVRGVQGDYDETEVFTRQ